MRYMHHTLRILTGILLLITCAAKLGILPNAQNSPEMFTEQGWLFISAINSNGYLFPIIGIVSLCCGLAFLSNRYVALAAIVYVPISLNFVLFHVFLGFPLTSVQEIFRELPPYVFFALNLYMLWSERRKYTALFES